MGLLLCVLYAAAAQTAGVTFLVFPPENRANPSLAWVAEGLAVSISEQIRIPGVVVLDRDERLDFLERADLPPGPALSLASMIRVGQLATVDYVVTGSYSGSADQLSIRLQTLDLKTMRRGGEISASGPVSVLQQMENELAFNLINNAGLSRPVTRDSFKKRMRIIPNRAFYEFIASLEAGNEEDRILALKRAVSAYADFPEALFGLGRYYYESGNCDSAIRYLEPARRSQARHLESQFMLGICYLREDMLAEAIGSFTAIVSVRASVAALNNLGVAELRRGDYALAVQHLLEAQRLSKSDPAVLLNLAILRYLQGSLEAAQAVLEQIDASHPHRPLVLYLLSRVHESRGEPEQAAAVLAQAKRLGADPATLGAESPAQWCRLFDAFDQR